MKKEEKERLHQDDAFVKFVRAGWGTVLARRKTFSLVLLVLIGGVIIIAITAVVTEEMTDSRLNTIDTAETIQEMDHAAVKYPKDPTLLLKLGTAYARRGEQGDLEESEDLLRRALRAAGNPAERSMAALALAKIKMGLEKYEQAIKLFDEAASSADIGPVIRDEANWHAGRCLELLGRPQDARETYSRVAYTARSDGNIWEALARYRQTELRQKPLGRMGPQKKASPQHLGGNG